MIGKSGGAAQVFFEIQIKNVHNIPSSVSGMNLA
jgi:hypothetical protein